jgi:hypothetical protein
MCVEVEGEGEVCIVIDGEAATSNRNLHKNAVPPRFLTSQRTCSRAPRARPHTSTAIPPASSSFFSMPASS